jgi:hypothetical protein
LQSGGREALRFACHGIPFGGDIIIEFYHKTFQTKMFSFCFNTQFVTVCQLHPKIVLIEPTHPRAKFYHSTRETWTTRAKIKKISIFIRLSKWI